VGSVGAVSVIGSVLVDEDGSVGVDVSRKEFVEIDGGSGIESSVASDSVAEADSTGDVSMEEYSASVEVFGGVSVKDRSSPELVGVFSSVDVSVEEEYAGDGVRETVGQVSWRTNVESDDVGNLSVDAT
jgi:hypothetical protein